MIDRIVVINDLASPRGGASLLANNSARSFVERGHKVTMITGDSGPADEDHGVEHLSLGQGRLLEDNALSVLSRGIYNRQTRAVVGAWIAGNDTPGTIYHVHGWSQILSPSLFDALAPVWNRVVMSAHDFFLTCPNGAMYDYGQNQPCERKPLGANCIVARCDRRNYAQKVWRLARGSVQARKLNVEMLPPQLLIHGGMRKYFRLAEVRDEDMFVLPNPVTPFCEERIPAEENENVLFVGRLEGTKGAESAAEACRRAGATLVAIGDGALEEKLKSDYPEMHFLGRLPHEKIGAIARRARMLVMPSFYMEPFGLTVVEALWSGLPVLTTDQALIASDIEETGAGLSIDPRDIDAFAFAIAKVAGDNALARSMSEKAYVGTRHLALQPDQWINALLAVYEAMLSGGNEKLQKAACDWQAPKWIEPKTAEFGRA